MNRLGLVLAVTVTVASFGAVGGAVAGQVPEASSRAVGQGVVHRTRLAPGEAPVLATFVGRSGDVLWRSNAEAKTGWRGEIRYLGDNQGLSRFEVVEFASRAGPSSTIGFLAKTPGRVTLPFKDADVFLIVEAVKPEGMTYHLEAVIQDEQVVDE